MAGLQNTITEVAFRSIAIIADGDRAAFDAVIAPSAVNHEADAEPLACRVAGPAGFHATSLWLRSAFSDIRHQVEHAISQDDLVALDTVMSGRHVGPFAVHGVDGSITKVWAPTGKTFEVQQSHWLRVTDGLVSEHWAVRDDLGQSFQLGWVPPTPLYLLRCAQAKRRAVRNVTSR